MPGGKKLASKQRNWAENPATNVIDLDAAAVNRERIAGEFEKPRIRLMAWSGKKFTRSPEWRKVRYMALKRSSGCCECCGNRGVRGRPLHVDHIKPRSLFPELQICLSNLQVLCEDCNMGKAAWDATDWRDL